MVYRTMHRYWYVIELNNLCIQGSINVSTNYAEWDQLNFSKVRKLNFFLSSCKICSITNIYLLSLIKPLIMQCKNHHLPFLIFFILKAYLIKFFMVQQKNDSHLRWGRKFYEYLKSEKKWNKISVFYSARYTFANKCWWKFSIWKKVFFLIFFFFTATSVMLLTIW